MATKDETKDKPKIALQAAHNGVVAGSIPAAATILP